MKLKQIFVCALCALMLTSCGAQPQQTASSTIQQADTETTTQPQDAGRLRELVDNNCNTGDAYYTLSPLGKMGLSALILKVDFASGEETCLCQQPGCKHDSESCNAFIANAINKVLYVVDNTLYLCNRPYFTEPMRSEQSETLDKMGEELPEQEESVFSQAEEESTKTGNQIIRIAIDGSEKSEPMQLPNDYNMQFFYTDGTALYGYARYYSPAKQEAGNVSSVFTVKRLRVNLTTGECTIWELSKLEESIGVYNNEILMMRLSSDQDLDALQKTNPEAFSAAYENADVIFYTLNPDTDERTDLCKIANSEVAGMRELPHSGDSLFYMKYSQGTDTVPPKALHLSELNLRSGEVTKLWEPKEHAYISGFLLTPPSDVVDGNRYLLCNTFDGKDTVERWYDVQTKQIYERTFTEADFAKTALIPTPIAQSNDGTWLFMTTVLDNGRVQYSTMPGEQYLAGSNEFRSVKQYEPT